MRDSLILYESSENGHHSVHSWKMQDATGETSFMTFAGVTPCVENGRHKWHIYDERPSFFRQARTVAKNATLHALAREA